MEALTKFSEVFVGYVWGLPLVFSLFGAGLIFTIYFGLPQFRFFRHALDVVRGKFDKPEDRGEINHFQALCAALSATVGLGNIAGVAVAVGVGGPGAVFWLWVAGFLGMATKFTEVSLSLMHRDENTGKEVHGGPMYTIKNGLGKAWMPMAFIYALFITISSFGAGNMFQANQMASIVNTTLGIPTWVSGAIFCVLAGLILIGGIKRIGKVTEKLVPIMISLYFLGAIGILLANISIVPEVFLSIFTDAFTGTAATGGFAGAAFKEILIVGVRRGVFSNEAGMGSAAVAHSAAKSTPIQEGVVALLEPFIDTIVVCTITALAVLVTGAWSNSSGMQGSDMTALAFSTLYGKAGVYLVMMTVVLFAFSTIISWSYYGEQGVTFIWGERAITAYRFVFLAFIFLGATNKLDVVLNLSDAFFGILAIPNLITSFLLIPKLKAAITKYRQEFNV